MKRLSLNMHIYGMITDAPPAGIPWRRLIQAFATEGLKYKPSEGFRVIAKPTNPDRMEVFFYSETILRERERRRIETRIKEIVRIASA